MILNIFSSTTKSAVKNIQLTNALKELEVLKNSGVAKSEWAATLAKKQYTEATIKEAIAVDSSNAAKEAGINANKGLLVSLKETMSAMGTIIATNPMIAVLGVVAAGIAAYGIYLDATTTSVEEAKKKTEQYSQKLNELQGEIDSINDKLKTSHDRITELLSQDTLTLTDKQEIINLQDQNDELERELRIKQELAKQAAKDTNNSATEGFYAQPDNGFWNPHGTKKFVWNQVDEQILTMYDERDRIEATKEYIDQLSQLNAEMYALESEQKQYSENDFQYQEISKKLEQKQELAKLINTELNQNITDFQEEDDNLVEGLSDKTDTLIRELDDIYNKYDELTINSGTDKNAKIDLMFEKDQFKDVKEQLVELGTISADNIKKTTDAEIALKDEQENLSSEWEKLKEWGLGDYEESLKNGTLNAKFGNIDMDKRKIITWSEELKKTYADALDSWHYNPEAGMIDTVFGGSDAFEVNDTAYEIAFSPILQTEDGSVFLSQDACKEYIQSVINAANADGEISAEEIIKIDAEGTGYEYGGELVKGLIAGAADWADENAGNDVVDLGALLHFSGNYGAIQLAQQGITNAEAKINALGKEGSFSVQTLTEKFPLLVSQLEEAGVSAQDLYNYIMALSNPDMVIRNNNVNYLKDTYGTSQYGNNPAEKIRGDVRDWIDELDDDELSLMMKCQLDKNASLQDLQDYLKEAQKKVDSALLTMTFDPTAFSSKMDNLSALESQAQNFAKALSGTDPITFDIEDIEGIRKSLQEAEGQAGVTAEQFNKFQSVLTNTASSAEDIKNAFDDVLSEWGRATLESENYSKEVQATVQSQLEMHGVTKETAQAFVEYQASLDQIEQSHESLDASMENGFEAFMAEGKSAQIDEAALLEYWWTKKGVNGLNISTTEAIDSLIEEAKQLGLNITLLEQYRNMKNGTGTSKAGDIARTRQSDGNYSGLTQADIINLQQAKADAEKAGYEAGQDMVNQIQDRFNSLKLDYNSLGQGAGKAGKDAGKEYVDGLKSQLSDLDNIISYVGNKLGDQISNLNDQRDASIDALNEEKDAAVAALEAERDGRLAAIDAAKEQLQVQIDAIDDEIDALQRANEERKQAINLQKAQYDLERMQHQQSILLYSEEKGMYYTQDTSGMRDAKQAVEDAELDIQISKLEDSKKLLEDQMDLLDKQRDEIEKYYDEQIKATEKMYDAQIKAMENYYDALIKNLEKQKTKFDEIKKLQEEAQTKALFEKYGIDEEALLAGSEEEFNKLKEMYANISNEISALENKSSEAAGAMSKLGDAATGVSDTANATKDLGTNLSDVESKASDTADAMNNVGNASTTTADAVGKIAEKATPASEALDKIKSTLSELNGVSLETLISTFTELVNKLTEIQIAIGMSGENMTSGSLLSALDYLNTVDLSGAIAQFGNLQSVISGVASAIGGDGASVASSQSGIPGLAEAMSQGSGGGTGGITGALQSMKQTADQVLGAGGGGSEETGDDTGATGGGSGVIGQFDTLKGSVQSVSSAIGEGTTDPTQLPTEGKGTDSSTLNGAVVSLGGTTKAVLGESGGEGVIGEFEQFRDVIGEAKNFVTGIYNGLEELKKVGEITVDLVFNITTNGEVPRFEGTIPGVNVSAGTTTFHAQMGKAYANGTVEGNAYVNGNIKGLRSKEKSLRSEYGQPELTVYPDGTYEITDSPTLSELPKGTVIFNESQTKDILKNGKGSHGSTFANGSTPQVSFAGKMISLDQIDVLARKLVNTVDQINPAMETFGDRLESLMSKSQNFVTNSNRSNTTNLTIGDIHLHEVKSADGMAQAIVQKFPNALLQELHRR